jgi:hypothetical protein
MSVDVGFGAVHSPSVRECLQSRSQSLTDTDLTEMEQRRAYEEIEEITSEGDGCVWKEHSDKGSQADVSKFGSC